MRKTDNTKQKMQDVSFRNIEDFLEYLPDDELKMVELLRKIIFNCLPDISEKLSYNVPFYKRHRNLLFIWPASVLWGKKKTYKGVRLGFTNGNLMGDENGYLDKGDRKQVYFKDFESIKEIDVDLLKSYIYDAAIIDEELKKKK
jgi:hypothetical protein